MKNMKRILVPIDFSEGSKEALEWATMLAGKTQGLMIYLLHVSPSVEEQEAQGFAGVGCLMEESKAKQTMEEWLKEIPKHVPAFPLFAKGRTPEAIEQQCKEKSIDLVIMTTRGRRGMQMLLRDSTTEETVRVAPCPVLVLHRNPKART